MASATVTSKGQITIPVEVRKALGLRTGDLIEFSIPDGKWVTMYAKNGSVRDLKGMLGKFNRVVSIEEMNEAIAQGAAGMPAIDDAEGW